MKKIATFILALTLGQAAQAQSSDLQALLSGRDAPTAIRLGQLDGSWRRVVIAGAGAEKGGMSDMLGTLAQLGAAGKGGGGGGAEAAMGMMFMNSLFGGGGGKAPVYYTQGRTVTMGSETFLVAYTPEKKEINIMELIAESQKNGGKEPDFQKLMEGGKVTAETPLAVSFINVKAINSLSGVRPFELQREIAESGPGDLGLLGMLGAHRQVEHGPVGEAHPEPATEVIDPDVRQMIRAAYGADRQLARAAGRITMDVSHRNRVVVLRGTVPTEQLRGQAVRAAVRALNQNGLHYTVKNELHVSGWK
jgi:hypothetical protein